MPRALTYQSARKSIEGAMQRSASRAMCFVMVILQIIHNWRTIVHMTIQENGLILTAAVRLYLEKGPMLALGWPGRRMRVNGDAGDDR